MPENLPAATPPRVRLSEWISIAGLLLVIIGLVWSGGSYFRQIQDTTRRVETLEATQPGVSLHRVRLLYNR